MKRTVGTGRFRTVLAGSGVYAIVSSLDRGLAFVLLPFYTHALTPSQYGQLSLILTVAVGLSYVLGFGLEFASFRTYFQLEDRPDEQAAFITTARVFALAAPCAALAIPAVLLWTGAPINPFPVRSSDLALGLVLCALLIGANTVTLTILRAQQQLGGFVVVSLAQTTVNAGLTFWLVVGLHDGVVGSLLGSVAGALAMLILGFYALPLRPRTPTPEGWRHLRAALRLGIPMVPHQMSQWGLQIGNRAVLSTVLVTTALGQFSLASNLGIPIIILTSALGFGVLPVWARAAKSEEDLQLLPRIATFQVCASAVLVGAAVMLGPVAIEHLVPSSYGGATGVAIALAIGYGFWGLYAIPMNHLTMLEGKSRNVWFVTVFGFALSVGLSIALVEIMGLIGAGIGSAIGFVGLFAGITLQAYRHAQVRVNYAWAAMVRGILYCLFVSGIVSLVSSAGTGIGVAIRVAGTLALVGAFGASGLGIRRGRQTGAQPDLVPIWGVDRKRA